MKGKIISSINPILQQIAGLNGLSECFFFVKDIVTEINLQQNHKNKSVSLEFSAANVAAVAKSTSVHLGNFLWASGGQRGTGM